MNVTVIGTGYVGLVTGCCLADRGHTVVCVDNDEVKVSELKQARSPIYEPGLEPVVESAVANKLLEFTSDIGLALIKAEYIFIAVGTPPGEDGAADLRYVLA
ncbi:MAG: 2-dehydropantoate 2-reductase N-terminal domain-containing protein, partial [Microcoleus sp.]